MTSLSLSFGQKIQFVAVWRRRLCLLLYTLLEQTSQPTKHVMSSFRVRVQLPTRQRTNTQRCLQISNASCTSTNTGNAFCAAQNSYLLTILCLKRTHKQTRLQHEPPKLQNARSPSEKKQNYIDNDHYNCINSTLEDSNGNRGMDKREEGIF